jgi:hypothetical protein
MKSDLISSSSLPVHALHYFEGFESDYSENSLFGLNKFKKIE